MIVRLAGVDDAAAIARTHVAVWHETYHGLVPEAWFDEMTVERRLERWRTLLAATDSCSATFVAVDGADVVGFTRCGRQRTATLARAGFAGEVEVVNILARARRRGVGRRLMALAAGRLRSAGLASVALWTIEANIAACAFYERLGGIVIERYRGVEHGLPYAEVAYGWRDLSVLLDGRHA